jgi:hypothetical protein
MEQPCYKCGQVLEEGRPFCPHCGAPQIRVLIAEPAAAGAYAEAASASLPVSLPASETVPVLAVPGPWSQALKPCALAAIITPLLMRLGLHPLMALFSAGFLAVIFYRQAQPGVAIGLKNGGRLGALSGFFCFALMALLVAFAAMVPQLRAKLHEGTIELRKELIESAQQYTAAHPGDAQVQAALDQMKTPEGFVMMLIFGGILLLISSIVLGALGGALGGGIFGRRDRS